MYEVDCPDCRHTFDASQSDTLVRCPMCSLEIELVAESEATGPSRASGSQGPYVESPCPHCGGLLMLAATDESGLCAHCERPLRFQGGRAFKHGERADSRPAADVAPQTSSKTGLKEMAGRQWYDPNVVVTERNAPLMDLGSGGGDEASQPSTRRLVVTAGDDASAGARKQPTWSSKPVARKGVARKKQTQRPIKRKTAGKKAAKKSASKKKSGKKSASKKKSAKKSASKKKSGKKSASKKKSAKKSASKKKSGKKSASKKKSGKRASKKKAAKRSSGRRGSRGV